MKVLLDTCVWGPTKQELVKFGHEVVWSGDWDRDPGDLKILENAHQEDRVLVTLDKDFGELAVVRGIPHSGIIRLVGFPARAQAPVIQQILTMYEGELKSGALLTVDPRRVRVRQAPA